MANQSSDRGVKAAAEDFTARLDRSFTVQGARNKEAVLRNTATEDREISRSAQNQAGHDLATWVQAYYAAGQGIGAMAFTHIR